MDPQTPMVLAVAVYADREGAVEDYDSVRAAKTEGEYDHVALAVLTKRPDGSVQVERHDSTAKHLAWGGAPIGGAALVVAPVSAPIFFATSVGAGGGATAAGLAGAGGIAGHFWHNVPKDKVREMSHLLEAGESGLIIVVVNKKGSDISSLLVHAEKVIVDDTTKGDIEAAYDGAIQAATTT
jgi:hypothetical protein